MRPPLQCPSRLYPAIKQRIKCRGAIFCARPSMSPPAGAHANPHRRSFFRRSRLFFREAAFFSGGEGCEWRAQRATVGASGKKLKTSFQALSHSSSHARASALTFPPPDFLFSSIPPKPPTPIPPKPHQIKQTLSKIAVGNKHKINARCEQNVWFFCIFVEFL